MNKKYPTFFLTWFNKFTRVRYPGPSKMYIGLCWYQKGTNNKGAYNHTNHLMIWLEIVIASASMTYITDLDVMNVIVGMRNSSTILLVNARILHYTCDRDWLLFKSIFIYFMLITIYRFNFLCINIVTCILSLN